MADKESTEEFGAGLKKAMSFGTDEITGAIDQMTEAGNELTAAFSQSRARVSEMMTAVNEAAPRMRRLGADFEETVRVMKDIAVATGKNTLASADSVAKLYATTQAIGGDVGEIVKNFEGAGIQFGVVGGQLEEATNNVRDLGLNAREVMGQVVQNASALNKFNFDGGVQGLSRMAARASQLKMDMGQALDFADRMMNPESAIEMASAFQRLGVSAGNLVDPFALMNQSINDPGALQESLAKVGKQFTYFDEKTKSFRINPQGILTLKEMEKAAGLTSGTL
jgi:methyl-accepting chemotaxis protein